MSAFLVMISTGPLHSYRNKHTAQFFGRGHVAGIDIKVVCGVCALCSWPGLLPAIATYSDTEERTVQILLQPDGREDE